MASRVTEAEVKVLLAPYADNSDVTLFVEQATVIVDEDLAGKGLSEARLRIIELNLAAHFAVLGIERGGFTMQKNGMSEERYANSSSSTLTKLHTTRFGQAALTMDTSGTLAGLTQDTGASGRAEFTVYG